MPDFLGMYRKNNVPHWQRVHQTHDGLRQWQKVRSNGGSAFGQESSCSGIDQTAESLGQDGRVYA